MKTFILPLIVTVASVNAGFLNGGHFLPATNVVASRTIVGGAIGGGPSSGAVSTSQYSQTVAAPATVHTVITSHPGYPSPSAGSSGGSSGNSAGRNSGGGGAYSNYVYNTGPGGSNTQGSSGGSTGYGGGSSGGGLNSGFDHHPSSYYSHQRHY